MSVFVALPRAAYPDNALDGFTAAADFKLDNPRAMMWLSQLAYETADESKVDDILKAWRLAKLGFASTFAGSDPAKPQDWITDFEAMPSPDDLHSGFEQAVETVWPVIQTALAHRTAPSQPLFFTGHSLGGALAILAASRAPLEPNVQQVVAYTFGSPRTGGEIFFDDYSPRLGDSTFRFIHGADIVPTVPLTLLHVYRHVGQAVQCRSGGPFDGVAPMARDGNKPSILDSAAQAGFADLGALAALQFVQGIGPGLRSELAGFLPRMVRDHVPQNYFRALSINIPAFGLID
jgi:triacylglycerol lipase